MTLEWFLFWILVVGSSLLWLAKLRKLPTWSWGAVLAMALLAFGAAKEWATRATFRAQAQCELTNGIAGQSEFLGYVSSDKCRSCHPDQYESWHRSYHRTMTQLPSVQSVKAPFGRTLELDGEKYALEQQGDEFRVEMVDPDWKHDQVKAHLDFATGTRKTAPEANLTPPRSRKRISLLTGSHHSYRSLRQIPGYERLQYDYVGPTPDLESVRKRVLDTWNRTAKTNLDRTGPTVFIEANGNLDQQSIDRLLQRRNNRAVELIE